MGGKVKVTTNIFKAVKTLISGGATTKECALYMGLSDFTISHIKASETYEEYKHRVYVTSGGYRAKMKAQEQAKKDEQKTKNVPEKKTYTVPSAIETVQEEIPKQTTIVVQATHYMMEEMKTINEQLKLLNNKLAFIVDELTK